MVHGAHDTNVPVSESEQIVDALRRAGRDVRYLLFGNDGHGIIKRENRAALAAAMSEWMVPHSTPRKVSGSIAPRLAPGSGDVL